MPSQFIYISLRQTENSYKVYTHKMYVQKHIQFQKKKVLADVFHLKHA